MQQKNTVCFVGGKSGGHIVPCLTLAQQQYKDNNILFFSTDAPLDQSILQNNPLITKHIALPLGTIRYSRIYHYPIIAWHMLSSFCTSIYHLYKHKPTKVISTGGLIGLPVCFAANLLRIPVELYELNAIPGKAARLIAPLAHHIHVSFEQARQFFNQKKCTVTPYPVRFTQSMQKEDAQAKIGLDPHKKTIFILGGSQGSIFLNNLIKDFFTQKKPDNIQVIHQTGSHDTTDWQQFYRTQTIPAHVFTYTNDITSYYTGSDLIIGRAGAGTLFEILSFNKPSIIIPLETKQTDHQYDNAHAMVEQYPEIFTMVRQNEIEKNKAQFFDKMVQLLQ